MKTRLLTVLLAVTAIAAFAAVVLTVAVTAAPDRPAPTRLANKRAARLDAAALLARIRLPAGAVSSAVEPAGDGGNLKPEQALDGAVARIDRHAWWLVPGSLTGVFAFIKANPPNGSKLEGSGGLYHDGVTESLTADFYWPSVRGVLSERELAVTISALAGGGTGVLGQSEAVWIVPRPPSERIPATAREIDITSAPLNGQVKLVLTVTARAKVRRIASLLNGLPIVQPGAYSCPGLMISGAHTITLSFRANAGGPLLARATYTAWPGLAYSSGPCNGIAFTVGGRHDDPLLGGNFLRRLQRLLGQSLL